MGLILVLVVLSAIQHGLTQDLSSQPLLRDNWNNINYCGRERVYTGRLRSFTLREVLTNVRFQRRPFTSGLLSSRESIQISGKEARFKMVEIRTRKNLYALQVDPSGERAFWLNQSIHMEEPYPYVDIPEHPTADQPKFVFTAEFSGCTWTVTLLGNGFLRLRNLAGPQQARQFNDLPPDQKEGLVTYVLQDPECVHSVEGEYLAEHIHSFAYMHYSGGSWTLHLQQTMCCPAIGKITFTNHTLSSVILSDYSSCRIRTQPFILESPKDYVTSTKDYVIPVV